MGEEAKDVQCCGRREKQEGKEGGGRVQAERGGDKSRRRPMT